MEQLLIIAGIVVLVFLGLYLVIPAAVKRGVDVSGLLSGATSALNTADVVIDGLQSFFPEAGALTSVDKIIKYAKQATEAAEHLYKTSQIEANERHQTAIDLIYDCLNVAKIEVTDDVRKVVDGCIKAAVFTLPKTHEESA